jgi:hypothetical protein
MRNSYAGIWFRCGKHVKPQEGHFELIPRDDRKRGMYRFQRTKWRLQHADCAIEHRGTKIGKT